MRNRSGCSGGVSNGQVPVGTSKTAKCRDKRKENNGKGNVSAKRADEVDEAEQSHEHEEETKACVESNSLETFGRVGGRRVSSIRVEKGLQGRAEGEPESPKSAKDDEGESVAKEEFTDRTKDHQESTKEEVCTDIRCTAAPGTSPSHEYTAEWGQGEQEPSQSAVVLSMKKISKGLIKLTVVLGYQRSSVGRLLRHSEAKGTSFQIAQGRSRCCQLCGSFSMQCRNPWCCRGGILSSDISNAEDHVGQALTVPLLKSFSIVPPSPA